MTKAKPPIPPPTITTSNTTLDFDGARKLFTGLCEKPRDLQVEAVAKVLDAHKRGARYVVLEAPTGVGKSHAAIALSRYFEKSFIGTLTAQLQEQYVSLFNHVGAAKLLGAGKFKCHRLPGATCADGRKEFQGEDSCIITTGSCPYIAAKERALSAPICVGNYHSLLYNITFAREREDGEGIQKVRPLMVCDEIHGLESMLLDHTGLLVRLNQFSFQTEALPSGDAEISEYWKWLEIFVKQLLGEIKNMPDPEAKEKAGEVLSKCNFALDARDEEAWIPERGERDDKSVDPTWFALKPLTVKRWGHWLWGRGDFTLLMSATVINAGALSTGLGLDLNAGDFIEMPCPFPIENRPIYATRLDMSMKQREVSWPQMIEAIDNLMNHHSAHKGLVLTPSNKMMEYIMKGVSARNRSRLIPAAGEDREVKYKEHFLRKDASVLLASGYWEGADLKEDAARFLVIPQLPRPFWAGQIKARAAIEPGWYEFKTWQKMIQGLGRGVRSNSDSCVSYVLDGAFLREMEKPKPLIPAWMRPAVKELS